MQIRKIVRRDGVNAAVAVNVGEPNSTTVTTTAQDVEIVQDHTTNPPDDGQGRDRDDHHRQANGPGRPIGSP